MSQGLERDEEDDDEVELEDDSVNDGELRDQTRPPVRARLLLALAGTGVLKQGFSGSENFCSGTFSVWFLGFSIETPVRCGAVKHSEKESSTK